jgi:hypothetical protein
MTRRNARPSIVDESNERKSYSFGRVSVFLFLFGGGCFFGMRGGVVAIVFLFVRSCKARWLILVCD